MRWDKDIQRPVPGTYRQKDEALERLLLSGWHKEDGLGRNADGIIPYVVDSCHTLDSTLSDHYRDFLAGHLRFKGSMSGMQDILCRLYFCDSEEDIWDMVLEGLVLFRGHEPLDVLEVRAPFDEVREEVAAVVLRTIFVFYYVSAVVAFAYAAMVAAVRKKCFVNDQARVVAGYFGFDVDMRVDVPVAELY